MKGRLWIVLAVALLLLAIPFLSCKKAAPKKVVVTWWHLDTLDTTKAIDQAIADAYMATHPNVEIQATALENEAFKTKINTMMQSGSPPDIFRSWGGGVMNEFAAAGLLRDITPELQGAWMDSIGESLLGLYGYKGKYYGVPYDMGAVGFWYNKELFQYVGYDNPPATWEDLLVLVQKLKDAKIIPISLGEGDKWPGHFWWVYLAVRIGGKPAFDAAYSRTGAFTDAPFVQAGEQLAKLIDMNPFQDGFLGATYGDQGALMGNGLAAMELMGQWAPSVEKDSSTTKAGIPDKIGFFPFPSVAGGAGKLTDVMGGGNGYVVGKNAPDEAVDFLMYLTNAENQIRFVKEGVIIPTAKGAELAIDDPMMAEVQKMVANATYYQLYYDQYLAPAVGEAIKDATQGLFAKTLTPVQVAEAIEKAMKEASITK